MQRNMSHSALYAALVAGMTVGLAACGGGSGAASTDMAQSSGVLMPLSISDASSEDWATIGVRVLSIALIPQDGGSPVTVWTAPAPAPYVNLEQLDQLSELLGNVSVPAGSYSGAVLTISANPGDLLLTVAADPESGFPAAAGTSIPVGAIQIQGTHGGTGSLTVPVTVHFASDLVVSSTQSNALDLEFDLANPAFIIGHTPPAAAGATLWAVNFDGPVRHRDVHDITRLVLRHTYGTVSSVAADNRSFTMTKDFPVLPVTNPESAVASAQSLTILADSTNGTVFYDVDAGTRTVAKDFSAQAAALSARYVRVAARYQQDGTLVAVRVWASGEFNKVWLSPEGHVVHVDSAANLVTVADESGAPVPVSIDANTQFYFRTPQDAQADATPIATGTAFLADGNIARGFKVHVSAVDPLATPLVAQSIDIETAAYSGRISGADTTGFTYTRQFAQASDDYSVRLSYIDAMTANGSDASGNAITGFKWWNFTFPSLAESGSNAVPDFVSATGGAVNFGGTVGALQAWGVSSARWADPANAAGWSARNAVLLPTPLPLGVVTAALANGAFGITVLGATQAVTVDLSTESGSATLVYQIDRAGAVITVSAVDVTSASGLASVTSGLVAGVPVKVFGTPQADGTLKAYVLAYYTGMLPTL